MTKEIKRQDHMIQKLGPGQNYDVSDDALKKDQGKSDVENCITIQNCKINTWISLRGFC